MASKLYAYPKLSRAGLGNLLFPWARCEIFRTRHKLPMLAPQWTSPKIGPILRGEKDMRFYTGLFTQRGYIGGFQKWWLLWRAARVPEAEAEAFVGGAANKAAQDSLIVFEGMEKTFEPLAGYRELLNKRLAAILRPAILKRATPLGDGPVIGVHIRKGDKLLNDKAERVPANFGERIPDDWFTTTIANVRKVLGRELPVVVFTDAHPGEIKDLEKVPNVSMAENNPSIVDILRLSRSTIMIGTSSSTFGMWGAFLGGMPSIWYPATFDFLLATDKPGFQITGGLDGSLPPACENVLRQAVA